MNIKIHLVAKDFQTVTVSTEVIANSGNANIRHAGFPPITQKAFTCRQENTDKKKRKKRDNDNNLILPQSCDINNTLFIILIT